MSDQGERGTRWTDMSENGADGEMAEAPTGPLPAQPAAGRAPRRDPRTSPRSSFPEIEVKVPEVAIPEPTGRTEFSDPDPAPVEDEPESHDQPEHHDEPGHHDEPEYHDVWGKVEVPHLRRNPRAEEPPSADEAAPAAASVPDDHGGHGDHGDHGPASDARVSAPREDAFPSREHGPATGADEFAAPGYAEAPSVEAKLPQETRDLADVVGPVDFGDAAGRGHEAGGPWWHDEPREPVPAWEEPKPAPPHERAPSVREAMGQAAHGTGPRAGASAQDGGFSAENAAPVSARGQDVPVASAHDEDIKVAPVEEPGGQAAWEGSLFEGGAEQGAGGEGRYAPVADPTAASEARPGRPSSGNWQMPGWMADERSADAMLAGGGPDGGSDGFGEESGGGRARVALFGGVGLLVVAMIAAGGVYFMQKKKDAPAASGPEDRPAHVPAATQKKHPPKAQLPPEKPLAKFAGKAGRTAGRVTDEKSGLSYPRFAEPWQVPTKKNKLGVTGWSGQQILVTERHGEQIWHGQLLTGTLAPALQSRYKGPESLRTVAALAANGFEKDFYGFPHDSTPLASQELSVGARKGWLVAEYLKYKRPGVRATGEVVVTAVVDTGHKAPAVAFASIPNTHRKLWPDINAFVDGLKVAP
ncbi:hypothetical protein DZF91_00205 [Actinomadura logoneensis]|uniref:Uncharacterized protein n=1 Tax=Actinomadura logoneensis TaxID=2293572 RepID=A0A372JW95_9ACTN|nr:hypothetical protein [Actinomadura logoneensis]RFU43618.1 hypothetical protein DZF91_00205 [Actinomadura logoneensis]